MRRIFASAVLAAALTIAGCADDPADPVADPSGASAPSSAADSSAASTVSDDKTACKTFAAAAEKMGNDMAAMSSELSTAMAGDPAKSQETLAKFNTLYTEFAAQVRLSAEQADSAELKDTLGKLADLSETAAKALTDPDALKDPQKLMATMTSPDIAKLQQTLQTSCA